MFDKCNHSFEFEFHDTICGKTFYRCAKCYVMKYTTARTKWRDTISEEQKQRLMQTVLANTMDGKYGYVVETVTDKDKVDLKYKIALEFYELVSESDGQFTGGYAQEVYRKSPSNYFVFSFQDGELYEYEKRIKGGTLC